MTLLIWFSHHTATHKKKSSFALLIFGRAEQLLLTPLTASPLITSRWNTLYTFDDDCVGQGGGGRHVFFFFFFFFFSAMLCRCNECVKLLATSHIAHRAKLVVCRERISSHQLVLFNLFWFGIFSSLHDGQRRRRSIGGRHGRWMMLTWRYDEAK